MPASSEKQRKLFALAANSPSKLRPENKSIADLPRKTLHDFESSSPKLGLDGIKKTKKNSKRAPAPFERDSDSDFA